MANGELTHIGQSNRTTGCGPACVAILSGCSEADAIKAIFGEVRSTKLRTEWRHLKKGLRALGVEIRGPARRVAAWSTIPSTAIVGCGKRLTGDGDEIWHWVVYQPDGRGGGLVYDPAHDAPSVPTARNRKPFSYLPVTPRK